MLLGLYCRVNRVGTMSNRLLTAACLSVAVFGVSSPASADELNFFNWTDYVGAASLEKFEKESGVRAVVDPYDSTDLMETKLLAGGSGYEVVMTPSANGRRLVAAGALAKIDKALLPNLKNADPFILKMLSQYDESADHLVPYAWGTTGIAYNPELVEKFAPGKPIDTLSAVFDVARLKELTGCKVAFIDEPTEIVPMTLKYLGLDPASESAEDLEKASAHLLKLRPYIAHFKTSLIATELANGELCAAVAYNGDVVTATNAIAESKQTRKISYALPREGTTIWVDTLALPKEAAGNASALKLIDFLLRPAEGADFSSTTGYATANAAALELLDPAIKDNPAVYPSAAQKATLFVVPPPASQKYLSARSRAWTRFRDGG
jgi:putrescine transport system substrate-binding protein